MKNAVLLIGVIATVVGVSSTPVAAQIYRLEMRIGPLECIKSEVVDGINTSVIVTPEECEEIVKPEGPKPTSSGVGGNKNDYAKSNGNTPVITSIYGIDTPNSFTPDDKIDDDRTTSSARNIQSLDLALLFFAVFSILLIIVVRKWSKDDESDLQNKE